MRSIRFGILAAGIAVCLSAGCATQGIHALYDGPERLIGEVAVVSVPYVLEVIAVDGRKGDVVAQDGTYRIAVLPGYHEMAVRYYDPMADMSPGINEIYRTDPFILTFDAEAGKAYVLRYETAKQDPELGRSELRAWMEVEGSGEAMGSSRSVPVHSKEEDSAARAEKLEGKDALPAIDACDQLMFWWTRATDAERRRFLEWAQR